jgi:hypothetical protein
LPLSPGQATGHIDRRQRPFIQRYVAVEPLGPHADADIDELIRLRQKPIHQCRAAGVQAEPPGAAGKKDVARADAGFQRRVKIINEDTDPVIAELRRSYERRPGEVADQLAGADGFRSAGYS